MSEAIKANEKEQDAEQMRLAFEAFMLKGKKAPAEDANDDSSSIMAAAQQQSTTSNKSKKKKKKKKSSMGGSAPPKPNSSAPPKPKGGSNNGDAAAPSALGKSDKKRYYQLLRSFNDKVQHTWLDIDDQVLAILQNIVSIRGRLPLEWKLLRSSHPKEEGPEGYGDSNTDGNDDDDDGDGWKYHGLLGKPKETPYSFHLRADDVRIALSSDLTQHEKMLAGMRSAMTNLAECHDGLGRAVDNLWKFHLECCEEGEEGGDNDDMECIVRSATEVYQMLSMELYRKQCLVPLVIDSTEDEILGIGEQTGDLGGSPASSSNERSGLKTARRCCKSWKRDSEESCIDVSLVASVLKLGVSSQQNNE